MKLMFAAKKRLIDEDGNREVYKHDNLAQNSRTMRRVLTFYIGGKNVIPNCQAIRTLQSNEDCNSVHVEIGLFSRCVEVLEEVKS